MKAFIGFIAAIVVFSSPALAQRGGDHKKDQPPPRRAEPAKTPDEPAKKPDAAPQHVPAHGPPSVATPHRVAPEEHRNFADHPGHPGRPHVDGEVWIGHDHGRDDPRFRLQRPWVFGRFTRIGPTLRWRIHSGGPERFYIGVGYFRVARWEYVYVNDWYWDRDEIFIYDDPDAEGWYVAYNVRLGTYVHVLYLGG